MTTQTDRYQLPTIQTGQSQKDVTHNDALARIDMLLHAGVEAIAAAPPPAPAVGQCWLIDANATGGWTGLDTKLARFNGAGWDLAAPQDGCLVWIKALGCFAVFSAGQWRSDGWPVKALTIDGHKLLGPAAAAVAAPAGGSVVDTEARAALAHLLAGLQTLGLFKAS